VSAFTVANEVGVLRHMLRLGKKWGTRKRVARGQRPSMLVIALPTLLSVADPPEAHDLNARGVPPEGAL
jgi:hypothetical protein